MAILFFLGPIIIFHVFMKFCPNNQTPFSPTNRKILLSLPIISTNDNILKLPPFLMFFMADTV